MHHRPWYCLCLVLLLQCGHALFTADKSTSLHYVSSGHGARCMDGSTPAYYLRRGHGSGARKWILHFEGGGWCYDLQQCYLRSRSEYGSSRSVPAHQVNILYFSGDESVNPLMYNWNTVYIEYCDGSTFAGDSIQQYLDHTVYFSGKANRDSVIDDLLRFDVEELHQSKPHAQPEAVGAEGKPGNTMATASEVVISGGSAGGLGVLLGIDEMTKNIRTSAALHGNHNITIRGLVDSAFFRDHSSSFEAEVTYHTVPGQDEAVTPRTIAINGNKNMDYANAMRDVFSFTNSTAGATSGCIAAHRKQPTNEVSKQEFASESACIFAANLLPHIKTPVFLVQPRFDTWQILHIHSQSYTAESVNAYGEQLMRELQTALFSVPYAGHGAFIDSCTHHGTRTCLGKHDNTWSGQRIRSTIAVDATELNSLDVRTSSEEINWNRAEAFQRWYRHSLTVEAAQRSGRLGSSESGTKKNVQGKVPGLNWFVQDQPFPCKDCCACSPRIAGQFANRNSSAGESRRIMRMPIITQGSHRKVAHKATPP